MRGRDDDKITAAWRLYEKGMTYNNRLTPNQYNLVETNSEFYIGNQWLRLPNTPAMRNLPKPVFNILKRVTSLFIASLASTDVAVRFEPLAYQDGGPSPDESEDAATFANEEVENLLEKFHFEYRVRDALFDGAITGDYCAHFWFDPDAEPYGGAFGNHMGEIQMELVDGINVMFGNPNDRRVDRQPYILIVGRDTVENLREEAERFKRNRDIYDSGKANTKAGSDEDGIRPDGENHLMPGVGGKIELDADATDGKALYVILYEKKSQYVEKKSTDGNFVYEDETDDDGNPVFETNEKGVPILDAFGAPLVKRKPVKHWETTIHVTKATRTAVIYEDVDTGLSRYPIAWGNWERQRNQYHGRSLITGLIPNQIYINTMFATVMRHMQTMAFPTTVYNADLIPNWGAEVGHAIGVHGIPPGQSISQFAYNLPVAEMSGQLMSTIDRAMDYTKECLGATDAQLGNANPENTSALMVLQTNAEVPLENIRAGLYEWIEDIGHILLEMIGNYYGTRPVVINKTWQDIVTGPGGMPQIDPMTGTMQTQSVTQPVTEEFDFSLLHRLWLNLRVDVGATTRFSMVNMVQTLDNLRKDGTLDVVQYLERLPNHILPKKAELIREIKARIQQGQQTNAAPGAAIPEPGAPVSFGALDAEKQQAGLPTAEAASFEALPNIAKKTALFQGNMRAT